MSEQLSESESSSEQETPQTTQVDAPRTDVVEKGEPTDAPAEKPDMVKVDAPQTDSVEFSEPLDEHATFDLIADPEGEE